MKGAWGIAAVAALLTPLGVAAQTIRHVPADYATIQEAILATEPGDIVEVAPGSYPGGINLGGRPITLRSAEGPEVTYLDGGLWQTVIEANTFETRSTVIQGFTILHGKLAGISLAGTSLTIIDNIFMNNWYLGAILGSPGSAPLIERNEFHNNCSLTTGYQGQGAVSLSGSAARIANNVFHDNACPAIRIGEPASSTVLVENNTIVNGLGGIHVDAQAASASIYRNNLIAWSGFGLEVEEGSAATYPTWQNNLTFGNVLGDYVGIPSRTGLDGNLSVDPKLSGITANDYHLDAGSPAIGAGTLAAVQPGDVDFYGGARVLDATVEIGAAEYTGAPPTVTLSGSDSEILVGESIDLAWSSTNAETCTADSGGPTFQGNRALNGTEQVTPPQGYYVFELRCVSAVAARLARVFLVVYGLPQVTFTVDRAEAEEFEVVTLSWTTYQATSCMASGGWAGGQPTFGSMQLTPGPGSYQYTLSCTGPGGTTTASATLVVLPAPTVNIAFTPSRLLPGGSATLEWSTVNAESCFAQGEWSGGQALSGTLSVGPLDAGTYIYNLSCDGPGGFSGRTVILVVDAAPAVELSADQLEVPPGTSVTLTWSTINAASCTASGAWSDPVGTSGSTSVTPDTAGTHTYTLTCVGPTDAATTVSLDLTVLGDEEEPLASGSMPLQAMLVLLMLALARRRGEAWI